VSVAGVTDPDGDPLAITITGIAQDEPLDGSGEQNGCPDGMGAGTGSAMLRAERGGDGDGRVYHVSFLADDGRGGLCEGAVTVCVPHDLRAADACIDQGPLVDSSDASCVAACDDLCGIERAITGPFCPSERVPRALRQQLARARVLLVRAAAKEAHDQAMRRVKGALKALERAAGIAAKAAGKGRLSPECSAALGGALDGAQARAAHWLTSP
jgi:hypothetical protein